MIIKRKTRKFKVNSSLKIVDRGTVILSENEMISLSTRKKNNEIVAKKWGFYLTPSINVRLKKNGYKCAIIINQQKKFFVTLVLNDKNSLKNFKDYLREDNQKLVMFLSNKKLLELLNEKNR